jgi:hypothetical protein
MRGSVRVGTVEPLVLPLQLGQAQRVEQREVPKALEQRPPRALELLALVLRGRCAHLVAAHLVDRVLREALDVEPVKDDLGVGRRLGDRLDVRAGHVDGHGLELGAAGLTELGEERLECVRVPAFARPDDSAGRVVDHHGHVLVVPAVGQLVNADDGQAIERIACAASRNDALHDCADGLPRDAHVRAHRGLVASLGQVGDVVFERDREP